MSFSERMNFVPRRAIQIDDIDSALRNRIINKVENEFDEDQAKYVLDSMGYRIVPEGPFSGSYAYVGDNFNELIKMMETLPWHHLYDVIEYGYGFLKAKCKCCSFYVENNGDCCDHIYEYEEVTEEYSAEFDSIFGPENCKHRENMEKYSSDFNSILEQEKSGYRLINGFIAPIVAESEIECIEEASHTQFPAVNTHFEKALQLYSNRKNPDYENSIKESISAVEAVCCKITEMTGGQATLGKALKKLESRGVVIHGALKDAFEKLYGYTSNADGIRHGGIDFQKAPAEDAKYMLISCSAFVNYLLEKYSKLGGTPE